MQKFFSGDFVEIQKGKLKGEIGQVVSVFHKAAIVEIDGGGKIVIEEKDLKLYNG